MKSNTQNAKIEAITEKTLVLGIDVGSDKMEVLCFGAFEILLCKTF